MIVQEYPYNGNDDARIRTYSDSSMMIKQNDTGIVFIEAVDLYPCKYVYVETEIPIEEEEENG